MPKYFLQSGAHVENQEIPAEKINVFPLTTPREKKTKQNTIYEHCFEIIRNFEISPLLENYNTKSKTLI